jgi:hypothetical protein
VFRIGECCVNEHQQIIRQRLVESVDCLGVIPQPVVVCWE